MSDNSKIKKKSLLTEIMTRKDGGSKGGASHKAHMSYYQHMRRMKKKNHSAVCDNGMGFGMPKKEQELNLINSDLDCVLVPENTGNKIKSQRSDMGDIINTAQNKEAEAIYNSIIKIKQDKIKFNKIKRGFKSMMNVDETNDNDFLNKKKKSKLIN